MDDLDYFDANSDFMKTKDMIDKEIKPFKKENKQLKEKIYQLEQKLKDQELQINSLNRSLHQVQTNREPTVNNLSIIDQSQIPPPRPPPNNLSSSKTKSLVPQQNFNYDNNPDQSFTI